MTFILIALAFLAGGTIGIMLMAALAVRNCETERIAFVFDWRNGGAPVFIEAEDMAGNSVGVGHLKDGGGSNSMLFVDVAAYEVRR